MLQVQAETEQAGAGQEEEGEGQAGAVEQREHGAAAWGVSGRTV
jgi:hypothetical protein